MSDIKELLVKAASSDNRKCMMNLVNVCSRVMMDSGDFYRFDASDIKVFRYKNTDIYCAFFKHVLSKEYVPLFFENVANELYFIYPGKIFTFQHKR